jgi:shikimate dehydrogenase
MTNLAGIIGHPVAHSLSPVFQAAAFAHCGLDVRYEAWETTGDELHARLTNLRGERYLGANVTIPHKEAVIPFLDELGGQSARVGAVNTIVNRGGRLFGFNTDGPGFVNALRHEAHFDPAGRSVLLLGAGGAARGIAFALADARAERVDIANRGPHRASRLALATAEAGVASHASPLDTPLARYDCIVNCTSIGMLGGDAEGGLPARLEGAARGALIVDIVYRPEETPFLAAARATGHPTLGGLPMLVYQGALSFELWTGVPAPVDVMFETARKALANERPAPS